MGLKIFLDVAWPKNLTFCRRPGDRRAGARDAVREAARRVRQSPGDVCDQRRQRDPAGHRALHGQRAGRAVHRRAGRDRQGRGAALPRRRSRTSRRPNTSSRADIDFVCFNVYLHDEQVFRNYLARLQNIAGEKPLMLGEYGIDTLQEIHRSSSRRRSSPTHVQGGVRRGARRHVHLQLHRRLVHPRLADRRLGVRPRRDARDRLRPSRRSMRSRTSSAACRRSTDLKLPKVQRRSSARTTARARSNRACARWSGSRYPDYEVIFVDDGSTDNTQEILQEVPVGAEHPPEEHGAELRPQRRHEGRDRRDHRLHRQRLRGGRGLALLHRAGAGPRASTSAWAGRT